jgi:hypothetical protein
MKTATHGLERSRFRVLWRDDVDFKAIANQGRKQAAAKPVH